MNDDEACTCTFFEALRQFEVDIELRDDSFTLRIDLLRRLDVPQLFRARIWRVETFRLQSTFPQEEGEPAHSPSDEEVLVEWSPAISAEADLHSFEAPSVEEAQVLIFKVIAAWAKRQDAGAFQGA